MQLDLGFDDSFRSRPLAGASHLDRVCEKVLPITIFPPFFFLLCSENQTFLINPITHSPVIDKGLFT